MNLVERVTHRNPSPPLTNDERRGLWAGKYYAIPASQRFRLDEDFPDVTSDNEPDYEVEQ